MTTIYGLHRAQQMTPRLGDPSSGVSGILLYGPKGCGKTLLVQQLAEAWLAQTDSDNDRAVESYRRGANPDFFHIHPTGAGSQIQLRQISTPSTKKSDDPIPLLEFVRVAPLYSRNKVVWLEDVHRLNRDSANSLLKTLEEPPSYVKMVLTTSQISQIPATILSRCLVVNCELPSSEELRQHYPELSESLLVLADGAPGTLERIRTNQDVYVDLVQYGDNLVKASKYSAMILAEDFRKLSDRLEDAEKQGARNTNARTLELIGISVSKRHPNRPDVIQHITEAHRRVLSNANPSLVLDSMIGKIVLRNN